MSYSNYNNPNLKEPVYNPNIKAILPGKYLDIDEKYYNDEKKYFYVGEVFGKNGKPLSPYGTNVKYNASSFVPLAPVLPLGPLKSNYGSYIYQQQTGYDSSHGINDRPAEQPNIIFR